MIPNEAEDPRLDRLTRLVAKSLIVLCVIVLALVAVEMDTGYRGRQAIVRAQRISCERGKLDREANAVGWRDAEDARWRAALDRSQPRGVRLRNFQSALRYQAIAKALEMRAHIDCAAVYPAATLLPWQGKDPVHLPDLAPTPNPPQLPAHLHEPSDLR